LEIEVKVKSSQKLEREVRRTSAFVENQVHSDIYYNSPERDFSKTDEALRVRREGKRITLTYKGPKLDKVTKSREEIIVPVGEGINELLLSLGFRKTLEVQKEREFRRKGQIKITLDEVRGLGNFIEFEIEGDDLEGGKKEIFSYMKTLSLSQKDSITKSYLELLLENRPHRKSPDPLDIPAAGVAVVERNGKYLVIRRGNEPMKSMLCFPTGHLQKGESVSKGTLRELEEETRIKGTVLNPNAVIYQGPRQSRVAGRKDISDFYFKNTQPVSDPLKMHAEFTYVFIKVRSDGKPKVTPEASEVLWMTRDELLKNKDFVPVHKLYLGG
jgi:adenylate cyclase class 2